MPTARSPAPARVAGRARFAALGLAVLVGVAACSSTGSSGTPRSTPPTTRPGAYYAAAGGRGYDVGHYDLRLRYTPTHAAITATARIDATATRALRTIRLDLVGLTVDGVRVDGRRATARRSDGVLGVRPAHPLTAGQAFRVEVRYHGVPRALPDPTEPGSGAEGSIGWNRTRGRERLRRQRARRGAHLVPGQRPTGRQGDVLHPRRRAHACDGRGQRAPRPDRGPRRPAELALGDGPPDGHLPRDRRRGPDARGDRGQPRRGPAAQLRPRLALPARRARLRADGRDARLLRVASSGRTRSGSTARSPSTGTSGTRSRPRRSPCSPATCSAPTPTPSSSSPTSWPTSGSATRWGSGAGPTSG